MRTRSIVAGVLVVLGAVWIGQGTGLIRGSGFMTDDLRWAIVGAALVILGLVVAVIDRRGRSNP